MKSLLLLLALSSSAALAVTGEGYPCSIQVYSAHSITSRTFGNYGFIQVEMRSAPRCAGTLQAPLVVNTSGTTLDARYAYTSTELQHVAKQLLDAYTNNTSVKWRTTAKVISPDYNQVIELSF